MELRYWNNGLSSVTNATSNSVQFSVQNQAYKDCMRNNFGKTQVTDKIDAVRIAFPQPKSAGAGAKDVTTNTTRPAMHAPVAFVFGY